MRPLLALLAGAAHVVALWAMVLPLWAGEALSIRRIMGVGVLLAVAVLARAAGEWAAHPGVHAPSAVAAVLFAELSDVVAWTWFTAVVVRGATAPRVLAALVVAATCGFLAHGARTAARAGSEWPNGLASAWRASLGARGLAGWMGAGAAEGAAGMLVALALLLLAAGVPVGAAVAALVATALGMTAVRVRAWSVRAARQTLPT